MTSYTGVIATTIENNGTRNVLNVPVTIVDLMPVMATRNILQVPMQIVDVIPNSGTRNTPQIPLGGIINSGAANAGSRNVPKFKGTLSGVQQHPPHSIPHVYLEPQ